MRLRSSMTRCSVTRPRAWSRAVIAGAFAGTLIAAPGIAPANEPGATESVEELLARIAAEREALEATRRQHDDVEAELEALRTRLEELEATTEARSERLRRLEDDNER